MKFLNVFSLMVMTMVALFTWQTLASAAEPMRIHLMQNLSDDEAKDVNLALVKLGYEPSQNSIFSESKNAIIVTKALKNEREAASLTVELVHLESEKDIPHTIFQYSLSGNDVQEMLKAIPKPEAFAEPSNSHSVAVLDLR